MDPLKPPLFRLKRQHWDEMQAHIAHCSPEEGCGLIAGQAGVSQKVFPITNALHSLVRFRMEPTEQLKALNEIDQVGWELLAIYHSHPSGEAIPSPTDIVEAYYPGVFSVIWAVLEGQWNCRAFLIEGSDFIELPIAFLEQDE